MKLQLNNEGGDILGLLTDAAIAWQRAEDERTKAATGEVVPRASNAASALLMVLATLATAQDTCLGGFPETTNADGILAQVAHEDSGVAKWCIELIETDRKVAAEGGRLLERVDALEVPPRDLAHIAFSHAERTFDALGYLPARVDPTDPTKAAKGRTDPDIPQHAADVLGMIGMANALEKWREYTGSSHSLEAKLLAKLAEYRAAYPDQVPAYIHEVKKFEAAPVPATRGEFATLFDGKRIDQRLAKGVQ